MITGPLPARAWNLIAGATGGLQGKSFWMSQRTYVELIKQRGREHSGRIYSVRVQFDDAMQFGDIRLERRPVT